MPLSPGTRLGPYEILSPLGAGGMGDVYRAWDGRLDRTVALKVMRSDFAADQNHRKRFLREVRTSTSVNHPGIVAVFDSGEADNRLYLAMEFIPGQTLQQDMENGLIPGELMRDYAIQIANALEHAHARGIIHRDIKPGNVIVAGEGMLKLLDFGLAQYIASAGETVTAVTAAGVMVGTWQYCAPEVLSGRLATVRSDIYSLGVVMYEMACGRVPFAGLKGAALVSAVLRGEAPPVRQRNPAVSETMAKLIARAMSVEPSDRFSSAAEFAAALRTMEDRPATAAIVLERAKPVIAVLDFENLSGDPATNWLGTGIAETIAADLGKLRTVQVISRERIHQALKGAAETDLAAIGSQLGVRWLVAGSYQRAGIRLRLAPRLTEATTGETAALGKIDGDWDDLLIYRTGLWPRFCEPSS